MSKVTFGVLLLIGWLLLWGEASVANVVGGIAVITLLFILFPSRRRLLPLGLAHPVGIGRLAGYFVVQVVVSTVLLAREILVPHSHTRSCILTVPMRTPSQPLLTLIADLTALTPGTMTVAVSDEPPCITMHVLVVKGTADPVAALYDLEDHCVLAFGTREEYEHLRAIDLASLPPVTDVPDPTHQDPVAEGEQSATGDGGNA
jgi:multicomponent Na+:H+ antiporter subunit E